MTPGCRAAVKVARQLGLRVDDPLLIQETNNTVVWLRPEAAIAKVGTHADSGEDLIVSIESRPRSRHVARRSSNRGQVVNRSLIRRLGSW